MEPVEGGDEIGGPGPALGDAECAAPAAGDELGGGTLAVEAMPLSEMRWHLDQFADRRLAGWLNETEAATYAHLLAAENRLLAASAATR